MEAPNLAEENYEGSHRGYDIYSRRNEAGTIYRATGIKNTFKTYEEVKLAIDKVEDPKTPSLSNELRQHLKSLGLDATIMDLEAVSNPIAGVRVEGRNISRVEIWKTWVTVGKGKRRENYIYSYVVDTDTDGLENELVVDIEPIKKGFPKKIVDFNWINPKNTLDRFFGNIPALMILSIVGLSWMVGAIVGLTNPDPNIQKTQDWYVAVISFGLGGFAIFSLCLFGRFIWRRKFQGRYVGVLARLLNADTDLKNELLSMGLVPDIGIFVRQDERNVEINYASGATLQAFPSREVFDAYDKIAGYVRSITDNKSS